MCTLCFTYAGLQHTKLLQNKGQYLLQYTKNNVTGHNGATHKVFQKVFQATDDVQWSMEACRVPQKTFVNNI